MPYEGGSGGIANPLVGVPDPAGQSAMTGTVFARDRDTLLFQKKLGPPKTWKNSWVRIHIQIDLFKVNFADPDLRPVSGLDCSCLGRHRCGAPEKYKQAVPFA